MMERCQMTVGEWTFVSLGSGYSKCGRPAKYRNPKPEMRVEFLCGIHAKSVERFYKRIDKKVILEKL